MIKLKCLIADDEPVARMGIKKFIDQTPFLEHVASVKNTSEIEEWMSKEKIDLILLDIEMPGTNGIRFLQQLVHKPYIIIITAHPQFAFEGFALDVTDYLLKPVSYERFVHAINKVRNTIFPTTPNSEDFIFIKSGTTHKKILISDIDYVEAKGNYVVIHTYGKSILTYLSIKKAETVLPKNIFLKTHKSYIVNILKITRITTNAVWLYNKAIPVSRSLKTDVTSKIIASKI